MRKYFRGYYVILSPKSSEDLFLFFFWEVKTKKRSEDQKKVFTAIWNCIRPEFVGFIRADRPFIIQRLNLDGGTLNLEGGTLTLDGGERPPSNLSTV